MILLMTSQGVNGNLDVVEKWKKKKIIHIHNNNVCVRYTIFHIISLYIPHILSIPQNTIMDMKNVMKKEKSLGIF